MKRIIAVTNQKGGVGKTTTVASLSGVFARRKQKVLAIDLDPQGNLSFSLGADNNGITVHDVLTGKKDLRSAIVHTENDVDVITSDILLSGAELEITDSRREFILKEKLIEIKDMYDYVLIDTPPALSILTINAYTAADDLIIPMTAEILSLHGITELKGTIEVVKKYYNKELDVRGILLTRYNTRYSLTKDVEEMAEIVAEQLHTKVLDTKIVPGVAAAEAPAHQKTLEKYAPYSKPALNYRSLAEELYMTTGGKRYVKDFT